MSKWHSWAGGPCPLDGDVVVAVQLRDGAEGDGPARTFDWKRRGDAGAIVCYRVVQGHIDTSGAESQAAPIGPKHTHYFKSVAHLDTIDVYRVLSLFNVTDPCLQHAIKKLLVAGGRGAGKDVTRDVQEAIDSLTRWQGMRAEDAEVAK